MQMDIIPEVKYRKTGGLTSTQSPTAFTQQKIKKMKIGGQMGNEEMKMNRALMIEIAEKKKI